MKKIVLSVSMIALVAVLGIGATRAFFSSTVTSSGNTFQTATMNIDVTNTAFQKRVLDGRGMYPGSFVQSAVTINNTGSVGINPDLVLANASGDPSKLWFEVWTNGKLWYSNWLNQFPGYSGGRVTLDKINAGESMNVAFRLIMDESADNSLQGTNYTVDLNVVGRQWNDGSYQPTAPQSSGAGYVVNTWSYNVCGVRQPGHAPLLATDSYVGTSYDYLTYSPFFSYRVDQTMVNNDSKWAVQTKPAYNFNGFNLANDGVCTLRDGASTATGANLIAYVAPNVCNATVAVGQSIQTAINAATPGQTVCVASGSHSTGDTYPLTIGQNITLAGLGAAGSAELMGGINVTADNVTITGLKIHETNFTGEIAAVYLSAGVDNTTVSYNELVGPGSSTPNSEGLINVTGYTVSGLAFSNNYSHGWLRGLFLNPSTSMTVSNNTLTGNGVGAANDNPHNATYTGNTIKNNTLEGIGVFANAGEILTANGNNIYSNGPSANSNNDVHNYGVNTVNAGNNWWGDTNPSDSVNGPVDYTPFATSAYPEY